MTADWKALCAELADALDEWKLGGGPPEDTADADLIARVRAALAQPEPEGEGVTDEALANFTAWFCRNYPGPDTIIHNPEWHSPKVFRAAAHALTRFARPAIKPVPVAERLPEAEDCDAEGRCWWWFADRAIAGQPQNCGRWHFTTSCASLVRTRSLTHWLPHHALPLPQP